MTLPADEQTRLAAACAWAIELHASQTRKQSEIPYVSHLLQVAGLVLEHGGSVDQAIAGLLHDAVEDTETTVADVRARFGDTVARIVDVCTDTLPGDRPDAKSPWRLRKERYLDRLSAAADDAILVAGCDKAHNLASLVRDVEANGPAYLDRFNPDSDLGWYHVEVLRRLGPHLPAPLRQEMSRLVDRLETLLEG